MCVETHVLGTLNITQLHLQQQTDDDLFWELLTCSDDMLYYEAVLADLLLSPLCNSSIPFDIVELPWSIVQNRFALKKGFI